jgi:hypothetical protein
VDERTDIAMIFSFMGHQSYPSRLHIHIREGTEPEVGHSILQKSGSAEHRPFIARLEQETGFEPPFLL